MHGENLLTISMCQLFGPGIYSYACMSPIDFMNYLLVAQLYIGCFLLSEEAVNLVSV